VSDNEAISAPASGSADRYELHRQEIRLPAPGSEFSFSFVQSMANRMAVSYHKYGALADAYPHRMDAIASIQQRLDLYHHTGNTEWLIDAANYAMIEFMHPRHPAAHFTPTDSAESPGRLDNSGGIHHDRY
jgi:hypothetical protein